MGGGVIFFNLQGRRSGEEVVLKRRLAVHLNGFDRVMDKSERKRNRMIFLYPSRDKILPIFQAIWLAVFSFRPPLKIIQDWKYWKV